MFECRKSLRRRSVIVVICSEQGYVWIQMQYIRIILHCMCRQCVHIAYCVYEMYTYYITVPTNYVKCILL